MRIDFVIKHGLRTVAQGEGVPNPPIASGESDELLQDHLAEKIIETEQAFERLTGLRLHLNMVSESVGRLHLADEQPVRDDVIDPRD